MSAPPHRLPTLLIVEDQFELRRLMARVLEEAGYQVLTAEDGVTAWELLQGASGSIDAVVTDVVMPRMTGLELADRVAAVPNAPPIVIVSGFSLDLGPLKYPLLTKPFSHEQLVAIVTRVLASRMQTAG
jgi:CheY-like chemotaxis protein